MDGVSRFVPFHRALFSTIAEVWPYVYSAALRGKEQSTIYRFTCTSLTHLKNDGQAKHKEEVGYEEALLYYERSRFFEEQEFQAPIDEAHQYLPNRGEEERQR